jgi:hypothetical protein
VTNKLDVSLSRSMLGNRERKLTAPNDEYLAQLEYEADFQLSRGLIKQKPDWNRVVDPDLAVHALGA